MSLTRRLFARSAVVAPLAAEAAITQRAATTHVAPVGAHSGAPISIGGTDKQWSAARALMRPAQKSLAKYQNRTAVMGGLDPDIMALRSISPSYKARMLAERRERMEAENESLWAWARRKVGLPSMDDQ